MIKQWLILVLGSLLNAGLPLRYPVAVTVIATLMILYPNSPMIAVHFYVASAALGKWKIVERKIQTLSNVHQHCAGICLVDLRVYITLQKVILILSWTPACGQFQFVECGSYNCSFLMCRFVLLAVLQCSFWFYFASTWATTINCVRRVSWKGSEPGKHSQFHELTKDLRVWLPMRSMQTIPNSAFKTLPGSWTFCHFPVATDPSWMSDLRFRAARRQAFQWQAFSQHGNISFRWVVGGFEVNPIWSNLYIYIVTFRI